jgi:DNA-binding transcriptional MerR regulator
MRMAELSRVSGVPTATIKYYLRENLLPRGEASSPNQATYGDTHVQRLRLIRALIDIGGLPVATVRDVLAAVDDPNTSVHQMLGATVFAVTRVADVQADEHGDRAAAELEELLGRTGWHVHADSPTRDVARTVLAALHGLGHDRIVENLDQYARAAEQIAEADLATVVDVTGRDARAEIALVATVLGDTLLAALRRMAQEHVSAKHFPPHPAPRQGEQS